jgi:serine/threonine protein kinase
VAQGVTEVGSTANTYQLLAKLAAGGMAEIFLAHGTSAAGVERYCVLKRILPERARDAELVQMFVQEARLAAQLQHPNIASVYDIGMLGDSYFFTMEYVHGETVRSLIERADELRRPLPLACVLTIIAGAAAGLHHAHERHAHDGRPLGIVHRDVSPSNLMVSYEGHLKLVDFGVAKAADRANETKAGTVKGKIAYLSPEQCRGARVDRRSDLFSLGIVLWELLTGARLYRRAGDFETMSAIVGEPTPRPSTLRSDVPREIDDLVLRLLAKAPAARFQDAGAVVEAIEHASLQAGAMLSSSAVSRLLRELFGTRIEPWRALEAQAMWSEVATIAARPLARTVELSDGDVLWSVELDADGEDSEVVELGLSSVIHLGDDLRDDPGDDLDVVVEPPRPTAFAPSAHVGRAPRDEATSVSGKLAGEILPPSPGASYLHGFQPTSLDPSDRTTRLRGMRRIAWPLVGVILSASCVGLGAAWLAIRHRAPRALSRGPSEAVDAASTAPLPNTPAPPAAPEPPAPIEVNVPVAAAPLPSSFEALSARYEARDYQGVVTACSAAASPAGITTICLMAACHLGDAVQAQRWLAAQPAARRAQLIATCAQLGTHLAPAR